MAKKPPKGNRDEKIEQIEQKAYRGRGARSIHQEGVQKKMGRDDQEGEGSESWEGSI